MEITKMEQASIVEIYKWIYKRTDYKSKAYEKTIRNLVERIISQKTPDGV